MEYNESQQNVTPDPQESELRSQNVEETSIATEPVKNIMATLGLISSKPMSGEKSQEEILNELNASERAQRIRAVQALALQAEASSGLQKALQDNDEAVRATAVNILGTLKEKAPLELLLTSLQDPAWYIRASAAHALGEQIERAPLVPLIEAMHDEDESVRAEAVWALGRLKEYAPEALLDMLHDPSWLVREAAELIMKERIEQAINNTTAIEHEKLVELAISGQEGELPERSLLELPGRKLPDTGPLTLPHRSIVEVHKTELQSNEQEESQRWGAKEVDEYRRISILPAQRRVSRHTQRNEVKRQQRNLILEKILVAVLILGLGVGWYSLDQRFHQSAAASQGSLTCVFHPGSNGGNDVIAWSPDKSSNALFAVAGGGGRVEVYQADSCRHMAEYRQGNGNIVLGMKWIVEGLRIAILTVNRHIVIIQENGNVQTEPLLDIAAGANVHAMNPLVAWSDDGQHIAVNWGDNTVQVWSIAEKMTLLATYRGSHGPISALALSPYGTDLAVATFDAVILNAPIDIWSVTDRNFVVPQNIYGSAKVVAMTWSGDGEKLLYYDQSNLVSEWSRQIGRISLSTTEYAPMQQAENSSLALSWAPDNTRFVMSTSDAMQLWNADTDSLLVAIPNTFVQINQLAWSMDGRHIAAAATDGTMQLWSIK